MHVTHFKKADVKRLTNELEREKECNNADGRIDTSRTKNNYCMKTKRFHKQLNSDLELRLSHVKHSTRKDLNVLSSWVITCPQELCNDPNATKQFFTVAFDFMCERYGSENVLNGYVHMDETTPHMHVPMIPVADERVSAKALFTRSELSNVHKDLEKRMQSEFGVAGLVVNGRTKGKYSVKELKARTVAEKDFKARQKALEGLERALKTKEQALALKESELALRVSQLAQREQALDELIDSKVKMKLRIAEKRKEQIASMQPSAPRYRGEDVFEL